MLEFLLNLKLSKEERNVKVFLNSSLPISVLQEKDFEALVNYKRKQILKEDYNKEIGETFHQRYLDHYDGRIDYTGIEGIPDITGGLSLCIIPNVYLNGILIKEFRCMVVGKEDAYKFNYNSYIGYDVLSCIKTNLEFNTEHYIDLSCYPDMELRTVLSNLLKSRSKTVYNFDVCFISLCLRVLIDHYVIKKLTDLKPQDYIIYENIRN